MKLPDKYDCPKCGGAMEIVTILEPYGDYFCWVCMKWAGLED